MLGDEDDVGAAGDAAVAAIQPVWRPITSTTITRWCASAVVCRRSTASVTMLTAVSKPKLKSVPPRSLSMVLGMPTTGYWWSRHMSRAAFKVPSPPTTTRAFNSYFCQVPLMLARQASSFSGLTREVPRIVPPRGGCRRRIVA